MNIFINETEGRVRAGWRLAFQFLMSAILVILFGILNAMIINLLAPEVVGSSIELMSTIIVGLGFTLSIIITAKVLDKRKMQEFGLLRNGPWGRELGEGIAIGAVAMAFIWLVQLLLGYLSFGGFGWERAGGSDLIIQLPIFMLLMMAVGFYEEYWVRGYQLKVLSEGLHVGPIEPKWAIMIAVAVTSLYFGIMHLGNPNASWVSSVNIMLAGIVLAAPYVLTGRLWVSIGMHFSWNFFQGGVFGFPVSGKAFRTSIIQTNQHGPEWFTGGAFGPEAGVVGVVTLAIILLWMLKRYRPASVDESYTAMVEPPNKQVKDNASFMGFHAE